MQSEINKEWLLERALRALISRFASSDQCDLVRLRLTLSVFSCDLKLSGRKVLKIFQVKNMCIWTLKSIYIYYICVRVCVCVHFSAYKIKVILNWPLSISSLDWNILSLDRGLVKICHVSAEFCVDEIICRVLIDIKLNFQVPKGYNLTWAWIQSQ